MTTRDGDFFLIATNPLGEAQPLIPGLDYHFKRPFEISQKEAKLIRESGEFREVARQLLDKYPSGFTTELEFDVYPLLAIWSPTDEESGTLNMMHASTGTGLLSYLTAKEGFCDQGTANIFSDWNGISIPNLERTIARYPQRPLAFTSFFNSESNNNLLSAAIISFAAAYFGTD